MSYYHPTWMISPVVGSNPAQRVTRRVWNRTGSKLTVGGIYQFDQGFFSAAAETVANSRGILLPAVSTYYEGGEGDYPDPTSCWNNIVYTNYVPSGTTGTFALQHYNFCLALTDAGDNEMSDVLVCGPCTVNCLGATTLIYAAGTPFAPTTNTSGSGTTTYGTMAVTSLSSMVKIVGYLTAGFTEATTPAATARAGVFSGFGLLR